MLQGSVLLVHKCHNLLSSMSPIPSILCSCSLEDLDRFAVEKFSDLKFVLHDIETELV